MSGFAAIISKNLHLAVYNPYGLSLILPSKKKGFGNRRRGDDSVPVRWLSFRLTFLQDMTIVQNLTDEIVYFTLMKGSEDEFEDIELEPQTEVELADVQPGWYIAISYEEEDEDDFYDIEPDKTYQFDYDDETGDLDLFEVDDEVAEEAA
jgi:hypothetical protein